MIFVLIQVRGVPQEPGAHWPGPSPGPAVGAPVGAVPDWVLQPDPGRGQDTGHNTLLAPQSGTWTKLWPTNLQNNTNKNNAEFYQENFLQIFSFCHLNSLKSSPSGQTSNGFSIAEETLSSCHFWRRGNIKNNDYVSRDTFCHNKIFFFHSFPLLHFLLPILWSWKLFEELKFPNEWNVVFSILFFFWAKSSS